MKDFNDEFIYEPTITTEANGILIKFSSGFAIFTSTVTNASDNYQQQGNIRLSDNIRLDISNLHLKSVLGVSTSKSNYNNNCGVYGTSFDTDNIYVSFFRGDQGTLKNASASVVVLGLWR